MEHSQWGGERGRHDVYGPTPTGENVVHEERTQTPAEIEVEQDQLAVEAMVAYILSDSTVELPESVLDRAEKRELLGRVIESGNFPLGDNPQTERFGTINKQVRERRMRNAATSKAAPRADPRSPKRYHRA